MADGGASAVRSLADDIVALGLDRYLLDTAVIDQAASDLTAWLREQTGLPVPGAVVRMGCRVVSAAVFDRLKRGAERTFTGGSAVAVGVFEYLPGAERFCAALRDWVQTKAADADAMAQLDAFLAGERREIDPELLKTLSTDLRFQLQQVSKLDGVREQLTVGFAELLERLNPQPQLNPKLVTLNESSRLHFGARKVPFVGRKAELGRLLDFAFADGDVAWWLVTGPGGMGKSRLVLELCHRAGACWRTGFLQQQQLEQFNWASWQPEFPHLLVVDYAAALPKAVGRMLEALRLRQHNTPLEMPVRVLLLERHREDRWWDELMGAGDRHGLAEILVDRAPLELGPLGPDGIWSMVAAIGGQAAETLGRDSALQRLTEIDPAMRPLFAALAGEALAAGADLRQWTRTDLLDHWLKREREKHWQPAGVDEPHANLAALATMVGGIAEDILATSPDGIELPRPEAVSAAAYAAITGRQPMADDRDTTWFPALEPDLLGTFFVLEHLRAPMGSTIAMPSVVKSRADTYRRIAWNRHGVEVLDFASFLDRAKDDFLGHPANSALIAPAVGSELSRALWAILVVNLMKPLWSAGRIVEAEALLSQLWTLAGDHPDEPELRLRVAQGSSNLIIVLLAAGRIDEAKGLLALLRTLAEAHPDEPELRLLFAKGGVNLIVDLGSAGRIDETKALLAQLKTLAEDHPDEPELRLQHAKGIFDLIVDYASARQFDEGMALLAQLQTLIESYPNEPQLRLECAKGIVSLINALGSAERIDDAEALLTQLWTFADDHPDEPELRLRVAKGSFNLIDDYASAGQIDEAKALLEQLRTLAEDHPDEPELRLEHAKGSVNLIGAMGSAGRIDEAEVLLAQIRTLAEGYPDEPALRHQRAKGSVNLNRAMGSAGRIDEAAALLAQLRTLAEDHPDEPELRLERAKGSVNLIKAMGSAERIDEAEMLLAQLRTLAEGYPDDPELRLLFAQGGFNLIISVDSAERAEDAEALLAELTTLADNHPDELPVVTAVGLAAVSVLVAHLQRKDAEGARAIARSTKGLLRHPAVIAELPQRFVGDGADQLEGLIEALLSDD